jgi:hypothetical protein
MNLRSIATRTATAGAATALAAAALVGASTTAASAATVTNTYNCSNAAAGVAFAAEMTVSGALPVAAYGAGAPVPATLLHLDAKAYVPDELAPALQALGITDAKSGNYAPTLGTTGVGVPLTGPFVTDDTGTYWDASGDNKAFVTPAPGHYDALLPASFTITTMQGDTESFSLECTLAEGQTAQSLGAIDLVKQSSNLFLDAKKMTVKKNKAVKIAVHFKNSTGGVGMGKVVAKQGTKTLKTAAVKNNGALLNLGKLKVGKHKIKVSYIGNSSISGSSAKIVVKVTK